MVSAIELERDRVVAGTEELALPALVCDYEDLSGSKILLRRVPKLNHRGFLLQASKNGKHARIAE